MIDTKNLRARAQTAYKNFVMGGGVHMTYITVNSTEMLSLLDALEAQAARIAELKSGWEQTVQSYVEAIAERDRLAERLESEASTFAHVAAERDRLAETIGLINREREILRTELAALRADAAKWREHVKPKIVGWMNPCNGVVISTEKKDALLSVGHGYPNFSVPVYAAIAAEVTKNG
jgi:hypothetical protein